MTHEQARTLVGLVLMGDSGEAGGRGVVPPNNPAMAATIKELRDLGYVTISEGRAPNGGHFTVELWRLTNKGLSAVLDPLGELVAKSAGLVRDGDKRSGEYPVVSGDEQVVGKVGDH